jgi:pimeloyl-ACP methyl ester carboxylesterase
MPQRKYALTWGFTRETCRETRHARTRVVELPGAGHLSNLENPAAFNRALRSFLDEVTG